MRHNKNLTNYDSNNPTPEHIKTKILGFYIKCLHGKKKHW